MQKMMMKIAAVASVIALTSCSPKIVGTWKIAKYESKTPNTRDLKVTNIGTLEFKRNKTGVKKISYSLFENQVQDNTPFKWEKARDGESITISGEGTQLNKTWLIIENRKKYQKWKSTDGNNTVQELELKK